MSIYSVSVYSGFYTDTTFHCKIFFNHSVFLARCIFCTIVDSIKFPVLTHLLVSLPINLPHISSLLSCPIGSFHFTYYCLVLGILLHFYFYFLAIYHHIDKNVVHSYSCLTTSRVVCISILFSFTFTLLHFPFL